MPRFQTDRQYRDRIKKHMLTGEPPARPPDYGRQSHRLLGQLVAGIRAEHGGGFGRKQVDVPVKAFERMPAALEVGEALIGDLTSDAREIAPDQDVFGLEAMTLAARRMRLTSNLTGRKRELAEQASARTDARLVASAEELERRAQAAADERAVAAAEALLAEYPDMDPKMALLIAGVGDDEGPVAA